MDISKAIIMLEQELYKISYLRKLGHKNQELQPWYDNVRRILAEAFGSNSREYTQFAGILTSLFRPTSDTEKQAAYNSYLDYKEAALKSIIEKYKTIRERNKYQRIWQWIEHNKILSIIAAIAAIATIVGVIIACLD